MALLYDHHICESGSSVHGDSPGKNTGVGCRVLFQGILPTWGSNSALPHCRRVLYHLSHQGSPRILKRQLSLLQMSSSSVLCPPLSPMSSSSGSSQSRNRTGVSSVGGVFFTSWATREANAYIYIYIDIYMYI